MNELLEARVTKLDLLSFLLLFTTMEEVIERFAQSVSLILKNLRVYSLELYVSFLDLCNLFVKIEASENLATLPVCFFAMRKHEVIQFRA